MTESTRADGILAVMMKRFETYWLPDALAIKERVDRGEVLSEWAAAYLDDVVKDISLAKPLVDRFPEFQPLYARTARMYREIASKALENERTSAGNPGS
jgi:hypothetical protein